MATSLPWSVKGVDPRTRDAAKAAARRAGMTLGEWLDTKIRTEADPAEEPAPPERAVPEQLDIAALSERLARLSQGQMETSPQAQAIAAPLAQADSPPRPDLDAVISQAAAAERLTRESTAKTAGALDSIARWIETTEQRMTASERAAAERQERATAVIADAIKTMSERIVDIERKAVEPKKPESMRPEFMRPEPKAAIVEPGQASDGMARPATRPFNRETLASAVTDIRTRQRALDPERAPLPQRPAVAESRIAALRQDLRQLSARLSPAPERTPASPPPAAAPPAFAANNLQVQHAALENLLSGLGAKLERLDRGDRLEPVLKPLARIESEVARLAQEQTGESYQRVEQEISHLAGKIDALAARGGDRTLLAPLIRDIGELRDIVAQTSGQERLEDLSHQIGVLSSEMARLRDAQPDLRDMRSLALAIEDVREAILSDREQTRFDDAAPLNALARQVEALAARFETLPAMRPELLDAQAGQLAARLAELDTTGAGASRALADRIETLMTRLETLAEQRSDPVTARLDALQQHIEHLAEQGPNAVTRRIEELAERIETLAASSSLSQLGHDAGPIQIARVDMRPVEDMLRTLADKIDEAGRPGADTDAFDALEAQISGLARRLDQAAATRSAESGIERTLQDLVGHLQTLRDQTSETAERAARSALAEGGAPARGLAELSHLVTGLKDTHVASGRETQDAIGAVHQTLETVISRLANIEAEIAADRQAAQRTPMPPRAMAQAGQAPAAREARPAPRPQAREDFTPGERPGALRQPAAEAEVAAALDMPLEPGSGRPRADQSGLPQDPQAIRQNLIAAARRSAKAASEAAAAPQTAAPEAGKSGSRLAEIMAKRKRPILLGLAAIVLALGTAHVVTGALRDNTPAPATKALEAPAASQDTNPAGKDQTSALPAAQNPAPQALASLAPPPQAAAAAPAPAETTGSTGAPPPAATVMQMPPGLEPLQPATGVGELPATLGTPGLRKAALAGDARAVYELAARAADGPAGARDPKLALRLFERAAVAGLPPAQFRLGNMFEKGVGTPRDIALARVWYTRAAERGNAKAMHNLAVLHAEGVSGKPDYPAATEWFRKAADAGVRDSQYNLAILLGRGLGVAADLPQSYLWFSVAAAQGDEDAGRKRDEVGQRLAPADLAAQKSAAERWRPKLAGGNANEVAPPAKGWDEAPADAGRKPAKPTRG